MGPGACLSDSNVKLIMEAGELAASETGKKAGFGAGLDAQTVPNNINSL